MLSRKGRITLATKAFVKDIWKDSNRRFWKLACSINTGHCKTEKNNNTSVDTHLFFNVMRPYY